LLILYKASRLIQIINCEYTILEAKNGAEAIQTVEQEKVDLILLDMQMPDMSGLDALKQIR